MKFKNFDGSDLSCDCLYDDPNYDNPFFVKTKSDEIVNVCLTWEQGRQNNYRFIRGGDSIDYNHRDIIWPYLVKEVQLF